MKAEPLADPRRIEVVVADNPSPLTFSGTKTYIVGGDPCCIVDPGPDLGTHLDAVEVAIGAAEVAAVCLTHWHPDHAAGAAELVARLGAPLAATAATTQLAELGVAEIELEEGSEIEFDGGALRVTATPGHSADHICFLWSEHGALFSGDTILGEGTSMIAPPDGEMAAYMETLERLSRLELRVIHPGHGPRIDDPSGVIGEYIAHRREREEQVLAALRTGVRTPAAIRELVYPDLDPGLAWAAEGSVSAHLEKLISEGRMPPAEGA